MRLCISFQHRVFPLPWWYFQVQMERFKQPEKSRSMSWFVTHRKKLEEVDFVNEEFLHKKINKNGIYMWIISSMFLGYPGHLSAYTLFETWKKHFSQVSMRFLTYSHIDILFRIFIQPPPPLPPPTTSKLGIQGPNLYIFLWYSKSKFLKNIFFEILNLKKSVCLKEWRLSLKQKNKTLFP